MLGYTEHPFEVVHDLTLHRTIFKPQFAVDRLATIEIGEKDLRPKSQILHQSL
jgi:hypothetical protein